MRLLAILAAIPLAACGGGAAMSSESGAKVAPAGSGDSRNFGASGFTQIDLRGSDDVEVKVGPAFAVRAEGPSEELDKLDIRKDGTTLKVGRVGKDGFNWGGGTHKGVKVFVTLPAIKGASVAGSGNMSIDRVPGDDFSASVAGSGDLSIAALAVKSADLSIAGSGDLAVKGQAGRVKASIAGSGNLEGKGLKASSAEVSVAGSGNVEFDVSGSASVSVVGSGDIDLGAAAKCSVSKVGSGEVSCGG